MQRIVLLEPKSQALHIFSKASLPRLGSILLGTILRQQGYQVDVMVEGITPLREHVLERADLVGISTITTTASQSYSLADKVRSMGIPVVLGGPHVTWRADEAMEHADYVIRGEGELSFPALLKALTEPEPRLGQVPGLTWREKAGDIRHNAKAPPVDLDLLPRPDLRLLGMDTLPGMGPRRIVPMQTSRGCPFDCSFCTVHSTFGRRMRYRSIPRVMDDIATFDDPDVLVFFYDDNFTASRTRIKEMGQAMIRRGFRSKYSAQVRAEIGRDPELLDTMKRSGCVSLYIGLESVNEAALRQMGKRQHVSQMATDLLRIRETGMTIHGMFVLGFDEDTPETLQRTVDFACDCGITSVQFLVLVPLPGSRTFRELSQQDRIRTHDWNLYDAHHVVSSPRGITPAQLQNAQIHGHRRFYSLARMLRYSTRRADWVSAAIALYARGINRRWKKKNSAYLEGLAPLTTLSKQSLWDRAFDGTRFQDSNTTRATRASWG